MLTDPIGINGRSLCSALQRLQVVGGGAASGGGGAVAVRVFCVAVCIDSKVKGQRLQSGFGASEAHTRVSAA